MSKLRAARFCEDVQIPTRAATARAYHLGGHRRGFESSLEWGHMLTQEIVADAARSTGLEPYSAVVKGLGNRLEIQIDANHQFYPASMIKTPLALAACSAVHDGTLHFHERFGVTQANMTVNDAPSPLVPGYSATLSELIDLAISRSDNVAPNMLMDILGREKATKVVQERYGLRHTAFYRKLSGSSPLIADPGWDGIHSNTHPTSDAAILFAAIANDDVPYSDTLRASLKKQMWNDKLSHGLHPGDTFFHKTGDTSDVTHDGGILTTAEGTSYVIVVYTGMESNDVNNAKFGVFMKAIRPYL